MVVRPRPKPKFTSTSAVRLVFKHFQDQLKARIVRLQPDNKMTMTYIPKQGSTVSPMLNSEAWQFLLLCDKYNIVVLPVCVPRFENIRRGHALMTYPDLAFPGRLFPCGWEGGGTFAIPVSHGPCQ